MTENISTGGSSEQKNNKKFRIWMPFVAAAMIGIGMLIEWTLLRPDEEDPAQKKLQEVLDIISQMYVDEINMDSLVELTIPSLLQSLDPHSVYIPASQREGIDSELNGSFSGVGIEFRLENDTIIVAEIIAGGPSEKVGLMRGDRIIEIDGVDITTLGIDEEGVRSRLRGEKNTKVNVKVLRGDNRKPLSFDIVRGDVPVTSVDAAYIIDENTGYIKVNKFSLTTYHEFLQSLAQLVTDGARDFVIDLRGNTGGYMEPALLMANEFLPPGMTIVSTRGRDPQMNEIVLSDGQGRLSNSRLVVIVDELTASASEIFSGAIQDNDRGLIIGRRTFGKGLVQQQIDLEDGSEVRLTVQRYYTPSGRSIQKTYKPGQNEEYEAEIFDRYMSGEMMGIDSTKINFDLIYNSVGGRKLYGGGGIIPDIFVPNDTLGSNSYYADIMRNGLLQKFATEYVSLNRNNLMKTKNFDEFIKAIPEDNILLWSFADYAKMNGVVPRWYYINKSADLIVTQLKALIAYDVLGRSAYYRVINSIDNNVSQALDAIKNGKADIPIRDNR